jgi:gas vesicle protein
LRNDGMMTGLLAGAALGALVVLAMSPRMRRPMMNQMGDVGDRMRGVWRRGARAMEDVMPGDEH